MNIMLHNSLDPIKQDFMDYLTKLGLSAKSKKNYKSDLTHFSKWLILKIRSFGSFAESLTETIPFLNQDMAKQYWNFMKEDKIPTKTINRRLSTLRHFGRFLNSSEALNLDFMQGIENVSEAKTQTSTVSPIVDDFRSYLESQKVSNNTIKNYLSDIRQFLTWVETNHQSQPTNH